MCVSITSRPAQPLNLVIFLSQTHAHLSVRREHVTNPGAIPHGLVAEKITDYINFSNAGRLAAWLPEFYQEVGLRAEDITEIAVVLVSPDEFPRWPAVNRKSLCHICPKVVVVYARPNLQSAWAGYGNEALIRSQGGATVCGITMADTSTDVVVCHAGEIIDTAAMGIGPLCIKFTQALEITEISDSGETFLDAVAKKIKAADLVEETMVTLISALIGEALANLICRKKAPQVTQRLLNSDPLKHDYQIDEIVLSGRILEFAHKPELDARSIGHLGKYLADNILASFHERQRDVQLVEAASLQTTISGVDMQEIKILDLSSKQSEVDYDITDAPLIAVPDWHAADEASERYLANRIEERMRRYHVTPGAPLVMSMNLCAAGFPDGEASSSQLVEHIVQKMKVIRRAVDAALFLKKPSDFCIILGTSQNNSANGQKPDTQNWSRIAGQIAALVSSRQINARILLAESRRRFADGDYIEWSGTGSRSIDACIKSLRFVASGGMR